jgi:hypothetical protein
MFPNPISDTPLERSDRLISLSKDAFLFRQKFLHPFNDLSTGGGDFLR